MGTAPRLRVEAPPVAPPRVGLLPSALDGDTSDPRWEGGIVYEPEAGQTGFRVDLCTSSESFSKALPDRLPVVEWEPYGIGDGIRCTALAARGRDWRAQARRQVEAVAEYQISSELMYGTLAQAFGYPNLYLADGNAAVIGAVDTDPLVAFACLEGYLRDCAAGQRGMIHASRQIVTRWVANSLVTRQGSMLLSVHDTVVVPGAGYTGTKAYATGMVEVRRGPIQIYGDPLSSDQIDRTDNTVEIRGEQPALASWDGVCHAEIDVDVDACAIAS